jgi:hypothetical protein
LLLTHGDLILDSEVSMAFKKELYTRTYLKVEPERQVEENIRLKNYFWFLDEISK